MIGYDLEPLEPDFKPSFASDEQEKIDYALEPLGEDYVPHTEPESEVVRKPIKAPIEFVAGTAIKAVGRLPKEVLAGYYRTKRAGAIHVPGSEGETEEEKYIREVGEEGKLAGKMAPPGKFLFWTAKDLAELPQNAAFSFLSMAAGLGAGVTAGVGAAAISAPFVGPAAPAVGKVAGYSAGTAAAGVIAFRQAKDQFSEQIYNFLNEQAIRERGQGLTQEEWDQLYKKYESKADQYGLWEAVPEALGDAMMFGIIRAPAKVLMKGLGPLLAKRGAALISKMGAKNPLTTKLLVGAGKFGLMQTEELGTETITQVGQAGLEADIGMRDKAPTIYEAFKEIAPQTILLTSLMGGAGAGVNYAYEKAKSKLSRPEQTIDLISQEDADDLANHVRQDLANGKINLQTAIEVAELVSDTHPVRKVVEEYMAQNLHQGQPYDILGAISEYQKKRGKTGEKFDLIEAVSSYNRRQEAQRRIDSALDEFTQAQLERAKAEAYMPEIMAQEAPPQEFRPRAAIMPQTPQAQAGLAEQYAQEEKTGAPPIVTGAPGGPAEESARAFQEGAKGFLANVKDLVARATPENERAQIDEALQLAKRYGVPADQVRQAVIDGIAQKESEGQPYTLEPIREEKPKKIQKAIDIEEAMSEAEFQKSMEERNKRLRGELAPVLEKIGWEEQQDVEEARRMIAEGGKQLAENISIDIEEAGKEAATSPANLLPAPTPAQIEAGNYKKGHINLQGLDITIENPKGSTREGTDKSGKKWKTTMKAHYGYIRRTEDTTGEQVDVFVGPNPLSDKVYVIAQVNPETRKFDEHKIMLGYDTEKKARVGYLANYEPGWKGLGGVHEMNIDEFKTWLKEGPKITPAIEAQAPKEATFIGYQDIPDVLKSKGRKPFALFNVESEGKITSVRGETLTEMGVEIPDHPSYEEWSRKEEEPNGEETEKAEGETLQVEEEPETKEKEEEPVTEPVAPPSKPEEVPVTEAPEEPKKTALEEEIESTPIEDIEKMVQGETPIKIEEEKAPKGPKVKGKGGERAPKGPKRKKVKAPNAKVFIVNAFKEGVKGADEALTGLFELFGGGGGLRGGIVPIKFDAETYAKAKPHFEAALEKWKEAGKNLNDLIKFLKGNLTYAINPYLMAWFRELKGLPPQKTEEAAPAPEPEEESGIKIEEEGAEKPKKERKKKGKKLLDVGEKLGGKRSSKDSRERTEAIEIELTSHVEGHTGTEIVRALRKLTDRATVFKIVHPKDRTPGAEQYIERIRDKTFTYLEMVRKKMYFRDAEDLAKRLDPAISPMSFKEKQGVAREVAAQFINAMEQMSELLKDATTIRDAYTKLFGFILKEDAFNSINATLADTDNRVRERDIKLKDDITSQEIGRHIKDKRYLIQGMPLWEDVENLPRSDKPIVRPSLSIMAIKTDGKHRDGKDVTGQDLIDTFGLRGVDFGEWAEAEFRQKSVNLTFDALYDLSDVTGLPVNVMANDKRGTRLGIGYGARGQGGRAAASYYPDNHVIGLTKTKGDGTLSHEWAHSLDYALIGLDLRNNENEAYRDVKVMKDLTEALSYWWDLKSLDYDVRRILQGLYQNKSWRNNPLEDAKDFLKDTWQKLYKAKTQFRVHAEMADGGKFGKYWSKGEEMWARAVEAFVSDTLLADKKQNYYLVSHDFVGENYIQDTFHKKFGYYPSGEERTRLNGIIKNFFNGMEWKDDGTFTMKSDYVPLWEQEKQKAQKTINDALARVEEVYKAIYGGVQSEDGLYWYAFKDGEKGAFLQPIGFTAFDDAIEISELGIEGAYGDGKGAIGYDKQLEPEDVIKHGLYPIDHKKSDTTIYMEDGNAAIPDWINNQAALGVESPEDGRDTKGSGDLGGDSLHPTGEGQGGSGAISGDGQPVGSELGAGIDGDDLLTTGNGDADTSSSDVAVPAADPIDYQITGTDISYGLSPTEHFANNFQAIKTLKIIESQGRLATPEEQKILVKFSGWGNMAAALDYYPGDAWKIRAQLMKDLLTPEEMNEARNASLNSYYTPPFAIENVWEALQRLGFRGGKVLETSMGIGHFYGVMPEGMRGLSHFTGIEKDSITARIAKQLYQGQTVLHNAYEEVQLPEDYYDVSIGNVPFGDDRPYDPIYNDIHLTVHDYFIRRTIKHLRPGGLMAVLTSVGTMDKRDVTMRNLVGQEADLIGAFRLPNKIFDGAEAASDILIFRKKRPGEVEVPHNKFKDIKEHNTYNVGDNLQKQYNATVEVNEYFIDNPKSVIGEIVQKYGRYGYMNYVIPPSTPVEEALRAAIVEQLPTSIYKEDEAPQEIDITESVPQPDFVKDGAYFIGKDGKIYVNDQGSPIEYDGPEIRKPRIEGMIGVRGVVRKLLRAQLKNSPDMEDIRKELNDTYEAFVKKFGHLNEKQNIWSFIEDPDAGLVFGLEKWDYDEGVFQGTEAILRENTIAVIKAPDKADTSEEALIQSLSWKGAVNLPYMTKLTGKTQEQIKNDLAGKIYNDPQKGWVTVDEYLSGNVRKKLETAQLAAESDKAFDANVAALTAVIPPDLTEEQIKGKLGSPWIPKTFYEDFLSHLFDGSFRKGDRFQIDYVPALHSYTLNIRGRTQAQAGRNKEAMYQSSAAYATWGTTRANLIDGAPSYDAESGEPHGITREGLFSVAINGGFVKIFDEHRGPKGETIKLLNMAETDAANRKIMEIRAEFERWIWEDTNRSKEALRIYNDQFNTYVDRKFDGSHLTFPGKVPDEVIKLRPHQKASVWRFLQTGSVYLGHEVGTGKTFTMIASIMEARRLGLAKKPVMAVKKATLEQIKADFARLYPTSNVLYLAVPDDMKQRKRILSKIALGNYDAVIMNHDSFAKIPMSNDTMREFVADSIRELEMAEVAAAANNMSRRTMRQIQNSLKKARDKLAALTGEESEKEAKEGVPTFEQMGIDMILIDEAHTHKNLVGVTSKGMSVATAGKYRNIKGLPDSASNIAVDLFLKTNYLHKRYGRGILLASGTPLSNSVGEVYGIQKYLQPKWLKQNRMDKFDAWVGAWGRIVSEAEYAPEGGGFKMTTKFGKFVNAPELMSAVRQNMDLVRAEDIGLKRPTITTGKPISIKLDPNETQEEINELLKERAKVIRADPRHAMWNGKPDIILTVINDGSNAAIDVRMYDKNLPEPSTSKVKSLIPLVMKHYRDTPEAEYEIGHPKEGQTYKEIKPTQLIFCDRGVPGGRVFNIYKDIKEKLIKEGIPAEEIAFIHDATDETRPKLFRRMRAGKIRILIGNTPKMGIGVNVQTRVAAIHHLDVDWNYSNYEQRNGRGWRFGNRIKDIAIYNYGTEKTVDAFKWDTVGLKAKVLNQIMSRNMNEREIDDISTEEMTANEMVAVLSGNPLHLEKMKLDDSIRQLENQKAIHRRTMRTVKERLAQLPELIQAETSKKASNERHLAIVKELDGIKIDDTVYPLATKGGDANRALQEKKTVMMKQADKIRWTLAVLGKVFKEEVTYKEEEKYQEEVAKETPGAVEKKGKWFVEKTRQKEKTKTITELESKQANVIYSMANPGHFFYYIGSDVKFPYEQEKGVARALNVIESGLKANITESERKIGAYDVELPKLKEKSTQSWLNEKELTEKKLRLETVISELLEAQKKEDERIRQKMAGRPAIAPNLQEDVSGGIEEEEKPEALLSMTTEEPPLLRMIRSLQTRGPRELVSITELRDKANISPKEFDKQLLALAKEGKVALHQHDAPFHLPEEKRAKLLSIEDPSSIHKGRSYFVGVVPKDRTMLSAPERGTYKISQTQFQNSVKVAQYFVMWLKMAGAPKEVLDRISFELKPFIDLRGKNVNKSVDEWLKEGITPRDILGATTIDNNHAIVQLALNMRNLKDIEYTALHEYYHIAKRWLLPQEDVAKIEKLFQSEEGRQGEANSFADFVIKRKISPPVKPSSALHAAWMKLRRYLEIIGNGLKGKGFARSEDIFGKLFEGQYKPNFGGSEYETTYLSVGAAMGRSRAQEYIDRIAEEAQGRAPERVKEAEEYLAGEEYARDVHGISKALVGVWENATAKGWKETKPDTTILQRWLQSPEFYFKIVPAAWRVFNAALEKVDDQHSYYNTFTEKDALISNMKILQKERSAEYQRLAKLIQWSDMNQKAITADFMKQKGYSQQAIDAWKGFRLVMDRGLEAMTEDMRQLVKAFEERGMKLPEVVTWSGDKKVRVNMKVALALMGRMKGWYAPRVRQSGRYRLIAKKQGANPFLEFFDTKFFTNRRAAELEAKGYTVEKGKANVLPEDVFEVANRTIGVQSMINKAMETLKQKDMPKTLQEFGLTGEYVTSGDVTEYRVKGPANKRMNKVFKELGGRWYAKDNREYWHFVNVPKDFDKKLVRVMTKGLSGPNDMDAQYVFALSLATEVANIIKGRGFRSSMIKRGEEVGEDVWLGYETDPLKAVSTYAMRLSAGLAKRNMAQKMVKSISGTDIERGQFNSYEEYLDAVKARRIDAWKQPNIYKDVTTYMGEMLRNDEYSDRVVGIIKGLTVLKYLGGRVSSAFVNLTALATSVPAAMHGYANIPLVKVPQYLGKAMTSYSTYRWGNRDSLDKDTIALFDHIGQKGWDNAQFNMEALNVLKSKFGSGYDRLIQLAMIMFGVTEKINRIGTIAGTYMAMKDMKVGNRETRLETAKKVSDRAHATYGKATRPFVAQGSNPFAQFGKMFYLFSKFSHNYLQTMYELGFQKKDWAGFTYMALSPAILGGAATVPLIGPILLLAASALLRGLGDDRPEEGEERVYAWLEENIGPMTSDSFRYGLVGVGGYGVNIRNSLAIQVGENLPKSLPDLLGAPGNVLTDLYEGGEYLMKGDYSRSLEKITPRVIGLPVQAIREYSTGITTGKNVPKFLKKERMQPTMWDTILRAVNFNPVHISKMKEQKYAEKQLIQDYQNQRSNIYTAIRAYYQQRPEDRRPEQYAEIMEDIREYNETVKRNKLVTVKGINFITKEGIKRSLKLKE